MNSPDLPLPALVLRESALDANIQRMAGWCRENNFFLAPHGKTTMCPKIFARQMNAGAWAMTVATVPQALVCLDAGIERVVIANQVTGDANIRLLAAAMHRHPQAEFFCLVDSVDGLQHLANGLQRANAGRPLNVLLEIGKPGWRTGTLSLDQARLVLDALSRQPLLAFCGFEAFEGLAKTPQEAADFLADVAGIAGHLTADSRAADLIFSVGGSSYLGPVKRIFQQIGPRWKCVLRSGCYVTHDHGIYARQQAAALEADPTLPRFEPALELWAAVQSLPDPGLAILTFGKRNCAYDITLPIPLDLEGATITVINDQHAYLSYPPSCRLDIGSPLRLGISHPCTAFDKWREIPLVDDNYNVIDICRTYF